MAKKYATNSDFILELDTKLSGEINPHWLAVLTGFQTLGEARSDTTSQFFYLDGFGASEDSIDGTNRTFSTTGHRTYGDPLQEWLFSFDRQWDTGQRYCGYRYYNTVTGEGEQGEVSISYTSTQGGAPQERASFGVTISVQGRPAKYQHPDGPFTVTYDGNGATGSVTDDETHDITSKAIVKSSDGLTSGEGEFKGWNTRKDGLGASYLPGDIITVLDNITLYAIWSGATGLAAPAMATVNMEQEAENSVGNRRANQAKTTRE